MTLAHGAVRNPRGVMTRFVWFGAAALAVALVLCPRGSAGLPAAGALGPGRYELEGKDVLGRYEGRLILRRARGGIEALREVRGEHLAGFAVREKDGALVARFEGGVVTTYREGAQGFVGLVEGPRSRGQERLTP